MHFQGRCGYAGNRGYADARTLSGLPLVQLPFKGVAHLNAMTLSWHTEALSPSIMRVRKPPEPSPPPIKEPPDPLENPDAPVREPDPDEPAQM